MEAVVFLLVCLTIAGMWFPEARADLKVAAPILLPYEQALLTTVAAVAAPASIAYVVRRVSLKRALKDALAEKEAKRGPSPRSADESFSSKLDDRPTKWHAEDDPDQNRR